MRLCHVGSWNISSRSHGYTLNSSCRQDINLKSIIQSADILALSRDVCITLMGPWWQLQSKRISCSMQKAKLPILKLHYGNHWNPKIPPLPSDWPCDKLMLLHKHNLNQIWLNMATTALSPKTYELNYWFGNFWICSSDRKFFRYGPLVDYSTTHTGLDVCALKCSTGLLMWSQQNRNITSCAFTCTSVTWFQKYHVNGKPGLRDYEIPR